MLIVGSEFCTVNVVCNAAAKDSPSLALSETVQVSPLEVYSAGKGFKSFNAGCSIPFFDHVIAGLVDTSPSISLYS